MNVPAVVALARAAGMDATACQVWYQTAPVVELTDLIPLTAPLVWRSTVKYPG